MSREKATFVERMREEVVEWERRIERLKLEASLKKLEAEGELESVKRSLRSEIRPFKTRLEDLSGASGEAWHDVASGLEKGWKDVKSGLKKAIERYE